MSKVKITGNVLSIQLGRYETRIALMGKGSEILHAACVATPEGAVEDGMILNADAVRGMLTAALAAPEFKKCRQAVFSLCTSQVITETTTTPNMPESRLEKLLQANVDTYFQVDMRDYRLAWQVVSTKKNELGTMEASLRLWAIPKNMISRYYAVANACGLSVIAVDYCGNSIASALGASFARPVKGAEKTRKKLSLNTEISFGKKKEAAETIPAEAVEDGFGAAETDLHLTMENELIGMTFVQRGQVVFQRFIPCGADPYAQLDELAMMVEYFRSMDQGRGSEIRGIVSGPLARDNDLIEGLQDVLGISLGTLSVSYDQRWMLCVGAARTNMDFGNPALNAPGKNFSQVNASLWQYALILVGGIALVLVIMMTLSSRLIWNSEIQSLQTNMQTLTMEAQKTAGFADNYKRYSSAYDAYSRDWDTVFASLRTYNDNLVLVLEELEAIIPENASVTDMYIAATGLNVRFACETKEEAAYLIMALRELTYADLINITNLSGGGGGPATSYGPGGESAPTEGSWSEYRNTVSMEDIIASELTEEELVDLAMDLTPAQIDLLAEVYGVPANPRSESLAALKSANENANRFDVRSAALREMLGTNPIVMDRFGALLEEDFYSPRPILWGYILLDVIDMVGDDSDITESEVIMTYLDSLLDILTKDEVTLAAVERLLCTDHEMEMWYVYYLETQRAVGVSTPVAFPYLNMDKLVGDLLSGGFDTGDPALDARLDGLISDDTWVMLDSLSTPEGVAQMLNLYLENGTTGSEAADAMIENFMATGSTGNPAIDARIQECIASGQLDGTMADLMERYLTEGTTGAQILDDMVSQYLATGSTGNPVMDQLIADYISSGAADELLVDLMDRYLAEGTTGVGAVDLMIEQYLSTGSTGNEDLDAIVEENMRAFFTADKVSELVSAYMTEGTTGVDALDELIERYTTTGSTGNDWLDELIADYMETLVPDIPGGPGIGDYTTEDLMDLMDQYLTTGTTGNILLDTMIAGFLSTGTTGNANWDEMIEDYIIAGEFDDAIRTAIQKYERSGSTGSAALDRLLAEFKRDGSSGNALLDRLFKKFEDLLQDRPMTDDELQEFLEQLQGMGGGTGGAGTGGNAQDTRIFFTVVLAYNDELKSAELERKGLYYDDKLHKLEVAE